MNLLSLYRRPLTAEELPWKLRHLPRLVNEDEPDPEHHYTVLFIAPSDPSRALGGLSVALRDHPVTAAEAPWNQTAPPEPGVRYSPIPTVLRPRFGEHAFLSEATDALHRWSAITDRGVFKFQYPARSVSSAENWELVDRLMERMSSPAL